MRSMLIALGIAGLAACSTSTPVASAPDPVTASAETLLVDTDLPVAPEIDAPVESVASLEPVDAVPAEPTVPLVRYSLRRGETLAHFARWSEIPVEEIADTSELELDGMYAVGTEIALAIDPEVRALVEARRDAHHRTRAESYLASRGSTGTEFYKVKTGDSAWTIARDRHGMPVWLLESLNPSANLERLRPGEQLLVPVFADIVVDDFDAGEPEIEIGTSLEHVE
ncbi:MAG: LysM peptidoglycan-binding domain-containing protein [Alphaproteobacteria bacterium]|nr:LysM peptidoglycan-binding domain-containing protein [Alphaproteobacteria bacterium]